jgi:mono/diheme cytochrome c family protein
VPRRTGPIAIFSLLLALGLAAGCVESDPDSAETPAGATTVVNSAPQTDSEGRTITAPGAEAGGEPGSDTPGPMEEEGVAEEGGAGGAEADPAAVELFTATGCGSCHTLAAAGSMGAVGPNLDESLQGQDAAYIEESILQPEAQVAEGFQAGVMPSYQGQLSPEEVEQLVALLSP